MSAISEIINDKRIVWLYFTEVVALCSDCSLSHEARTARLTHLLNEMDKARATLREESAA